MYSLDRAIVGVIESVCATMLELEVVEIAAPGAPIAAGLTARVEITGGWSGMLVLRCDSAFAHACAAILFADDGCGDTAARDAVGELTSMVAGNLKALLPAPARLALPSVSAAGEPDPTIPGDPIAHVHIRLPAGQHVEIVLAGDPVACRTTPAERGETADTIFDTQTLHEPS